MFRRFGFLLARYLSAPRDEFNPGTSRPGELASSLKKGDVLLLDTASRISSAIKYLTQSSWPHAAIFIGNALNQSNAQGEALNLIEADVVEGVRAIPLSEYENTHSRICRPVGLTNDERNKLLQHVISRIGHTYDLKNIFDLARYFITSPPVPNSWKRRMIAFGSGDPTRAICSSMIAEAFQSIKYPILPDIELLQSTNSAGKRYQKEVLHIRHHSLFSPRDFDVSPYFDIIKPTLKKGFDFHSLKLKNVDKQSVKTDQTEQQNI